MYDKLYNLFGRFITMDETDRQILEVRFEPMAIKKKEQLIEYGQVANHFFHQ